MLSVLIVSQDSRFLDCVSDALQSEGMWAVSLKTAAEDKGFHPRAIVVDPAVLLEPHGDRLAKYLASSPATAAIPVLSVSSASKRVEIVELLETLHRLEEDAEPAWG
jgi:hypothetical protein